MNRLYAVNSTTAFAYDLVGNRLQRREHNQHTAYAIAADSNRLLSSSGQFPGSFTTNANGNITHYRNPDGAQNAVTYDAFDRMATHTRAGVVTQYAYDAFDQRVAKRTGNAAPTRFINDGHRILAELGSDGRWINYLWIGGQLVGQMHGVHLDAIHTDQLGRPEVMTDAAKTVRWRAANWPFDRKAVAGYALNAISIGLPGQYYDVESGLWHNGYRYYADWLGRYLQTDPIGLGGGLNTYGYVSGNPTARVDPWGLTELNLFNPQEGAFHERAALYQSPIGIFTVAGHGSPGFMEGADARAMSTSALAAQIMAHPKFSDAQQLQLASCNTGKGAASIAQQLANETGKPVTAPNNFLFFRSNGSFYLGDAHPFKGTYVQGTSGDWVTFYPRTGP
jgi:RHS repeat-associated protein